MVIEYLKISQNIKKAIARSPLTPSLYSNWVDCNTHWEKEDFDAAHASNRELRQALTNTIRTCTPQEAVELIDVYKRALLLDARHDFESFIQYIEFDAKPNRQFYAPRARYLRPIVKAYQELFDGKLRLLTVSLPKRAGKTTTGILATLFISGKRPELSTLIEGAGDALVTSFYNGLLEYLLPDTEYKFYDVFPGTRLVQRNADTKILNLTKRSRFPTIMCRSLDALQIGLSEATNMLYLDDCVEGYEEAMNRQRLDYKWAKLRGDVIGRAIGGTPIVAQGTRYSIYDPIARLQEEAQREKWAWKAVEIPALDLATDESNYEFSDPRTGRKLFTTAFFREQRNLLSAEQWESEFQQQPFESKGLLFNRKDLNYFYALPVDKEPDTILAVCDTAESGKDSTALAILYVYGEDVFLADVVFDNSPASVVKPQCAKKLVEHKCGTAIFESNGAGEYFGRDVNDLVKTMGGRMSLRTKRTITNKKTRIEYASDTIIKHFYFWAWDVLTGEAKNEEAQAACKRLGGRGGQYWNFMREVTTYTRSGKVPHDDAPDVLSLAENELRYMIRQQDVPLFMRPC